MWLSSRKYSDHVGLTSLLQLFSFFAFNLLVRPWPALTGSPQTVTVFQTMESSVDPYTSTFIVGVVQLLATGSKCEEWWGQETLTWCSVSLVLVDRAGRRPLLIISGLVMSLTMGSLALYLTFISQVPGDDLGQINSNLQQQFSEYLKWLPLTLIIGSFIGFSVGFATIPFCIMGELLPQRWDIMHYLQGHIGANVLFQVLFFVLTWSSWRLPLEDYMTVNDSFLADGSVRCRATFDMSLLLLIIITL